MSAEANRTVFDSETHTVESLLSELERLLHDGTTRVNTAYIVRRLQLIVRHKEQPS
jgi:hypothetical protein